MFISQEEADRRLKREENVLRDVSDAHASHDDASPDELDVLIDAALALGDDQKSNGMGSNSNGSHRGHVRGQRNTAHFANRISDQKALADVALIAGDSVARDLFGVSVQQANAYEKGQRSSDKGQGLVGNGELLSHVTRTKEHIRGLAAKKLELALDHLTTDKIESTTRATDIGRLAKDLATVHDKMERKESAEAGVQFHVFVPEIKQITNYNVIKVSSEPLTKDSEQI